MTEKTVEISSAGLRFHTLKTDKFKMSRLSFNFILPADAERSPQMRLMLATMMRGCKKYPSVVAINKRLDELYGASVTTRATTAGDRHIFRISSEFISDKYRFEGDRESVVLGVCSVIMEILFAPLLDERGLLLESNFESERKLAIDAVRSRINDQKAYAAEQCLKLLYDGDPMGCLTRGTVEQLEKMTIESISENIKYLLENSVVEVYYVGSDDIDEVISLVSDRINKLMEAPDFEEKIGGAFDILTKSGYKSVFFEECI